MATLFLFLWSSKSWRETVMTDWRLHWGLRGSSHLISHMLSSILLCMLNLSVFIFVMYLCHFILLYLNNCMVIYCFLMNKSLRTHSRVFCIFVMYLCHFILLYLNNCMVIYCFLVNKSLRTHSRAFCIT